LAAYSGACTIKLFAEVTFKLEYLPLLVSSTTV